MVPKLRFKEFCGEWEKQKYSTFFEEENIKINEEAEYPLYSLTIENGVTPKTERYERSFLITKKGENYKKVNPGSFVYNPMNLRFGALSYNKEDFPVIVSGYYNIFKVKNPKTIGFWNNYLKTYKMLNYYYTIATGSLIEKKRVHFSQFLQIEKEVPSLPEQTKIADFLSTVDDKIQNQEDKITHLENIKKGFMQKIFSRKIRFKDDRGEEFPEWEEKKLKEIVTLNGRIGFRGYTVQDIVKKGEGAISLSPSNIIDGNIDIINTNLTYISMYKYNESPEIKIEKNDILLTKTASVGRCGIVKNTDELMTINPQMVIIRSDNINMYFLNYQLNNQLIQKELFRRTVGGVVPTINQEEIYKIKIKVPCSKEQQKIVDFLSLFDEKISTEKETLEHLKQLKKGLLQQVFV